MRIIFVVLLIVNAIYAMSWSFYSGKENPSTSSLSQINSQKIVLIPSEENCLAWGNFDEEQLHEAEISISEIVPDQSYNLEEAGHMLKYWLYIPAFRNKDMANRMINKLRNLGIVSFRIKDENSPRKNAVSLGMFADKADAETHLNDIEKKGIPNGTIEERTVAVQKIVIHGATEEIKQQLQEVMAQFEGTRLVQIKCERL
ncbi:MAG TPA: SPOR domain-containing protein [Nitrosomonas sp.]|nr:SPOR domain-containing protein [Nitrosomonas sp.]